MADSSDDDSFETSSDCTSTSSSTDPPDSSISSGGIDPVKDINASGNLPADATEEAATAASGIQYDDDDEDSPLALRRVRQVLTSSKYKKSSRASSLGQLRFFDDRMLLMVARCLGPRDLVQLGYVSWMFLAVAHDEPTWRRLTLLYHVDAKKRAATFCYHGSWRRTCLHPKRFKGKKWNEQDVLPPWKISLQQQPQSDLQRATSPDGAMSSMTPTINAVSTASGDAAIMTAGTFPSTTTTTSSPAAAAANSTSHLAADGAKQQVASHETERRYWMVNSPTKPKYAGLRKTRHQRWYDNDAFPPENNIMFLSSSIERRSNLTYVDFVEQYEKPNRPVIITDATRDWKARERWNPDALIERFGETLFNVNVKSTRGKKFRMRGFDYFSYCHTAANEKYLYVFDKKILATRELRKDYDVPIYFSQDLFNFMTDDDRPDYRWFLMGPNGSGSPMHTDPHATSAWNAVMYGAKRVTFYPPDVLPPGVDKALLNTDLYPSDDVRKWYQQRLPRVKPEQRPMECIVRPGETLFIPSMWWHSVQNIGLTIAVTQNVCSLATFPTVATHVNLKSGRGFRQDFKCAISESEFKALSDYIVAHKDRTPIPLLLSTPGTRVPVELQDQYRKLEARYQKQQQQQQMQMQQQKMQQGQHHQQQGVASSGVPIHDAAGNGAFARLAGMQ